MDPRIITQQSIEAKVEAASPPASPPESELIEEAVSLMERVPIHRFERCEEGDWIAKRAWRRPRRVMRVDATSTGHVLFLAEPDDCRARQKIRRVDRLAWERSHWDRFPNLRKVWDAAH